MRLLPRLIDKAHELGFEIRGGDLFRDPRLHGAYGKDTVIRYLEALGNAFNMNKARDQGYRNYGKKSSEHKNKCAIDLNLFQDGQYRASTDDHRELGTWWEDQHTMCRWGGRYNDGNHYEVLPWR